LAESSSEAGSAPAHIPALDGLRGVAILLVLLLHYFYGPVVTHAPYGTLWIDRQILRVASLGWVGVDLFFVLSGFLITRILLGAREGGSYFRSFYARRFLRIFPIYYGFLFFLIVILPNLPGFRGDPGLAKLRYHELVYWTYLLNVAVSLHPLVDRGGIFANGHLWSLAVEEQFYLIWPLVVFLLGRRGLGIFCVLCVIAAPAIRYGLLHGAVPPLHSVFAAYTLMPARMDALALGGLIAVVEREPDLLRRLSRWALPVGGAAALFLAILYLSRGGLSAFDEPVEVFGYSAIALTCAALLTMMVGGPPGALQAVFGHRGLKFFGKYSYGLYVLHIQILYVLFRPLDYFGGLSAVGGSYLPAGLLFAVLATACAVTAAWLSWHLYEKHFLKLKRFLPYGRPRQRLLARSSDSMSAQPESR
jgi:peptidoglycan/LPS O-acetylase OafA/YrhL